MKKRILIVEDDLPLLNVLSAKVKELNYVVVEAIDGKQAIRKFKKESPDLVLLDIILPLKNGFEVLKEIKMKQKSKIPVLILSNLGEPEDIEKGKKLGAIGFITKSNFTLKEIMTQLNKAIKKNE